MNALDVIVFDCDGVLLDSVRIKTETFGKLFEHLGPQAKQYVTDYHLRHGGVSRYAKFAHYFEKFHNRPITDEESAELDKRFNQIALEQLLATPLLPGVEDFLKTYCDTWPLYVASGAPQYELEIILNKLGLAQYFKGIYGSPTPKATLLANVVKEEQAIPDRVLMIGDSSTDLEAAQTVGTRFVGIGEFPAPTVWINAVSGLHDHILSLG